LSDQHFVPLIAFIFLHAGNALTAPGMLAPEEDPESRFVDPATTGCDNYDANC
jgi:hypothetical protein